MGPPARPLKGMSAVAGRFHYAWLERILAWLTRKFTRNFSSGQKRSKW
jgi:hypothetical protein